MYQCSVCLIDKSFDNYEIPKRKSLFGSTSHICIQCKSIDNILIDDNINSRFNSLLEVSGLETEVIIEAIIGDSSSESISEPESISALEEEPILSSNNILADVPAEDVPAEDVSVEDVPTDDVSVENVPTDDLPADDSINVQTDNLPELSKPGDIIEGFQNPSRRKKAYKNKNS
jgi:hypothetical protein